ncbi:hypothetical protein KOW79_005416 [Hemibagrus wyckioides]|uniref:Uncharacterized protein n=1 Tax=Hemibagrus wyckioides TaxID=337641 RepID=A0A9D3SP91_9TELE|nr:hypothetical protein KOW79_005416 [Hemibagrus wyckioides]
MLEFLDKIQMENMYNCADGNRSSVSPHQKAIIWESNKAHSTIRVALSRDLMTSPQISLNQNLLAAITVFSRLEKVTLCTAKERSFTQVFP